MRNCGCNDYSRTQLLRRAAAEADAGCPRSSRGCRCPRAPGSRGARSSRAPPGSRCPCTAPRASGRRRSRRASPPLPLRRPPSACSCRSSSRAGRTRSRCSRRRRASAVRRRAADPRAARRSGHAAHRGQLAALAPVARRARGALRRGQGERDAGHRLRRREPVALHQPPLLGGRRGQPVRPLGLARPLPRPSRRGGQPASGARLSAGTSSRCWPRATCRWPRWRSRTTTTSGLPGVWGSVQDKMLDAFGDLGDPADQRHRPRPGARRGGGHRLGCATSWRRSRAASRPPGE